MTALRVARDHAQKKAAHATKQDPPEILKRREERFDGQLDLDPEQFMFIDETWASTNVAGRYGRAPRGERLRVGVPHGVLENHHLRRESEPHRYDRTLRAGRANER